jgi:putative pyruvate formate lyase activating enzyme
MTDLPKLAIWHDPAIASALSWYLDVAENRPAKFRIAASVATQLDLGASSEHAPWNELDRLTPVFVARWRAIQAGASLPPLADGPSLLELCRELAYRMLISVIAISVRGIVGSIGWLGPSSAPAS